MVIIDRLEGKRSAKITSEQRGEKRLGPKSSPQNEGQGENENELLPFLTGPPLALLSPPLSPLRSNSLIALGG
jgi:hypothetical protein